MAPLSKGGRGKSSDSAESLSDIQTTSSSLRQPWLGQASSNYPIEIGPITPSTPWPDVLTSALEDPSDWAVENPLAGGVPGKAPKPEGATDGSPQYSDSILLIPPESPAASRADTLPAKFASKAPKKGSPSASRESTPQGKAYTGTWVALLWHWFSLLFAQYPVRQHRQWLGVVMGSDRQAEPDSHVLPAKRRLPPELDRGLGRISEGYSGNRKRRRLNYGLRKRAAKSYTSFWDWFANEVFVVGELVFDWCTPSVMRGHMVFYTSLFILAQGIVFAFMAGQFPEFIGHAQNHPPPPPPPGCSESDFDQGPSGMLQWVVHWPPCKSFTPDYLILWGARYLPKMEHAGQVYRWLSALLLRDNFPVLAAGLALFAALSGTLECRYGSIRIGLLSLGCGVACQFFSAAFQDPCNVVLGAGGCAWGLLGLFLADLTLNFASVPFPAARIAAVTAGVGAVATTAAISPHWEVFSSLGGFLAGLAPGALLLPNLRSERFEWPIPYVALVWILGFLLALPVYVYVDRMPGNGFCPEV